ncbi:hypothetical protein NCPPB3778_35 [Rathayibacter phage NCPPB3778]|nr:hypothetical protein NCPPB3778_35 [Rathayibacter phage NCPPB3778]
MKEKLSLVDRLIYAVLYVAAGVSAVATAAFVTGVIGAGLWLLQK